MRIARILLVAVILLPALAGAEAETTAADSALVQAWRAFAALPEATRAQRAGLAREGVEPWLKYYTSTEAGATRSLGISLYRVAMGLRKYQDPGNDRIVDRAVGDLRIALKYDPTFLEAHLGLAILEYQLGRCRVAVDHLAFVRAYAAEVRAGTVAPYPGPVDDLDREACRYLAWAHRELGQWDAGLAAADEGLAGKPGDKILILARCLLLAGAGRGAEALRLASQEATIEFRHQTALGSARVSQPSTYAKDWVASQVFLAEGEVGLALAALNEDMLEKQRHWRALPFYRQYWNDVGLVCELNGDITGAKRFYDQVAQRHVIQWLPLIELEIGPRRGPVVPDLPNDRLTFFGTGGGYLWGSPFSYAAHQFDLMVADLGTPESEAARGRALDMVRRLDARHIRPDFCHAMLGRIAFIDGDWARAESELLAARDMFVAAGDTNSGTSLLLGFISLDRDPDRAEIYFRESVAASDDPAVAWRGLAVALGRKGQPEQALKVMETALELDPRSVAGWFNQGILLFEVDRFDDAEQSFLQAMTLGPDDAQRQEIVTWLQRTSRAAP